MRQIASEYYIKNTFNITGVTSNGDNYCPTYQEIISTSKIGVNGTYSNNQLVCQEDLFSMSNYVTIYLINQSGHELINVYIAANGNGYLDISSDHTAGSLTNLADGDEDRMVFDKGSDSDNTYMIGYEYSMFEGEYITEPLWIGFSENSNDVEFKYDGDGDGYVATINYDNKELYIQAPTKEKEITITYYTFVDDNTSNISIPLKVVFDYTQATTMVMALTDEYWNEQITSDFSVYDKSRGNNVNILNNGIVVCNTSSNMYLNVCNNSGIMQQHIISDGDGINMENMTLNTDNLAIVLSNRENDYVNPKRGKLQLRTDNPDGNLEDEFFDRITSTCLTENSGKNGSKYTYGTSDTVGRILLPKYAYEMTYGYTPCVLTAKSLYAGDYYMVLNGYEYKFDLTDTDINTINNGNDVYKAILPNGEVNWE